MISTALPEVHRRFSLRGGLAVTVHQMRGLRVCCTSRSSDFGGLPVSGSWGYAAGFRAFWLVLILLACPWPLAADEAADQDAFVRVSPRDARYFELSNGRPYIPIGFNLVPGPRAGEFERVVGEMARNRINYCRIWADQAPWGVETQRSGQYGTEQMEMLRRFLTLCRQHGIRVKICLEYFRDIPPQQRMWSDKSLHHRANGGAFESMKDFLESPAGIAQFQRKIAWYADQIGDEPAVFAWELWNEMNAVRGPWAPWTEIMLRELHRHFPKHMAIQSLGSFDRDSSREPYRQLCLMPGNDIAQVHRYLDQGAELRICHGPVDLLAADAVAELTAFHAGKPIILTETGAVKPSHTGCSELYAADPQGQLLHDMLFAPFFTGAAGPGHVWWWRQAIEQPKLWSHFARFAELVDGIDPASEHFEPQQLRQDPLRFYVLKGTHTLLIWCRDGRNSWQSEIADGERPAIVSGVSLDASQYQLDVPATRIRAFDPWNGSWTDLDADGATIQLPDFQRSLVLRVDRK